MNDTPKDETEAAQLEELRALEAQITAAREESAKLEREAAIARKREEAHEAIRRVELQRALAKLVAQHGPVGKALAYYLTSTVFVVVKKGDGLLWERFLASERKLKDAEDLVRACLVHPAKPDFDRMVSEYAAILMPLANKIGELYGLQRDEDEKKL